MKGLSGILEGTPFGIRPVVLFKIVFIQYMYGIKGVQQTIKEIGGNIAYRWFFGYDLTEPITHFRPLERTTSAVLREQISLRKASVTFMKKLCGFGLPSYVLGE